LLKPCLSCQIRCPVGDFHWVSKAIYEMSSRRNEQSGGNCGAVIRIKVFPPCGKGSAKAGEKIAAPA
jgi:hypothetical protein